MDFIVTLDRSQIGGCSESNQNSGFKLLDMITLYTIFIIDQLNRPEFEFELFVNQLDMYVCDPLEKDWSFYT